MVSIRRADAGDSSLLADIGRRSFIESHGNSAAPEDIDEYVTGRFTADVLDAELLDPASIYHIITLDGRAAGYSKIVPDAATGTIARTNITQLSRLYLLSEFYGRRLGAELLRYNIALSRDMGQAGMWLYTWTENQRAVDFYLGQGFRVVGNYNFRISERHSNPNYQMWLEY